MYIEKINNTCKCGFSCTKLVYFNNHKNNCLYDIYSEKFDNILKNLEIDDYNKDFIKKYWMKYSDRIFMKEFYPKIAEYINYKFMPKILDICFENFNIIKYNYFKNTNITYLQLEPSIENNIYKCIVSELLNKYPQYSNCFQIIIDFEFLGESNISKDWNIEEINKYIINIYNLLVDTGIFCLKIYFPYLEMSEYKIDFDKMIYPYFNPIIFENIPNGIHIFRENNRQSNFLKKDQYKFFFLEKKKKINNLVIVAHPDDESIWCDEKLNNNTHVIVVFGFSKLGLETSKIREQEFINAMKIVGCSYEIWNYPEKQLRIKDNILNEIFLNLKKVINKYNYVKTVYTHNHYGEYGHIDHIRLHRIINDIVNEYYTNNRFPKFYQFYPLLNYKNDDKFYNIPFKEASKKRRKLLDCYKSQTIDKYTNIVTNFIDLNSNIL
jgi:LmbE family N-acetylglucosaminyl deacetylase